MTNLNVVIKQDQYHNVIKLLLLILISSWLAAGICYVVVRPADSEVKAVISAKDLDIKELHAALKAKDDEIQKISEAKAKLTTALLIANQDKAEMSTLNIKLAEALMKSKREANLQRAKYTTLKKEALIPETSYKEFLGRVFSYGS